MDSFLFLSNYFKIVGQGTEEALSDCKEWTVSSGCVWLMGSRQGPTGVAKSSSRGGSEGLTANSSSGPSGKVDGV